MLPISTSLDPIDPDKLDRIPVYRLMQEDGSMCEGIAEPEELLGIDRDGILSMY